MAGQTPDTTLLLERVREAKTRVQEHPEEYQLLRERQRFFDLVKGLVNKAFSMKLLPSLSQSEFPLHSRPVKP